MRHMTLLLKALTVLGIWTAAGAGGYSLLLAQGKAPPATKNPAQPAQPNQPGPGQTNPQRPQQGNRPLRTAPQQPSANLPNGGVRTNTPHYQFHQGYLGNTNAPNAFNNWNNPGILPGMNSGFPPYYGAMNPLFGNPFSSPFDFYNTGFNPYLQSQNLFMPQNPWAAQNPFQNQMFANPMQNAFQNPFQVQNPFLMQNQFNPFQFNNPFLQFPANSPFANVNAFLGNAMNAAPVVGAGFGGNGFGGNGFNPALGFRP